MHRPLRVFSMLLMFLPAIALAETIPPVSASAAARFLEQASWGPTASAVSDVRKLGLDNYLEAQFAEPESTIADVPVDPKNQNLRAVQQSFFLNSLGGKDQLRQRVAFALSEIWVVSGVKIPQPQAIVPYLRLFQKDAFGSYLTLMTDLTLNPAMGHYLDMVNNDKPDLKAGKTANENYARELMQLFTLGTVLLKPDGTPQIDPATHLGKPVYTQDDVQNLGRAFTGWTYPTAPGAAPHPHNPPYWDGPMTAVESLHDVGSKTLLGKTFNGLKAELDLQDALQEIFQHPNMGPFVCKQLIEHLITSNPSPAYVTRVAGVFDRDAKGARGDLKSVVKAILLDPEARQGDAASTPNDGHLREPVLFITGLLRAFDGTVTAANTLADRAKPMGQELYYSPSVFSYFSPGYHISGTSLAGPEFQIYSPATAMIRADFVNSLVYGNLGSGTTADFSPYVKLAANPDGLLDTLDSALLHGKMPAQMRTEIKTAMASTTDAKSKAQTAIYLGATSPEYQVEH
ncbi:MAG: DUF1800 domain-containing protein [Bryobacteraceae bacterium]